MKSRKPCIHGNLCRGIYKLTGRIYSVRCPYGYKFYESVEMIKRIKTPKKGDIVKWQSSNELKNIYLKNQETTLSL